MTHASRTGFAVRLFVAMTVGIGLLHSGSSQAGKPSPPPPPPTGTIYYKAGGSAPTGYIFNAIKPNGTGLTQNLLPNLANLNPIGFQMAIPCGLPQGNATVHDRWWIIALQTGTYDEVINTVGNTIYDVPHYDLFAVRSDPQNRSQLVTVQLTDLYGIVNLARTHAGRMTRTKACLTALWPLQQSTSAARLSRSTTNRPVPRSRRTTTASHKHAWSDCR